MTTLAMTYQFKLYQSRKLRFLDACIDLAAEVWNFCIAFHRRFYKMFHKYPSAYSVKKLVTKLKYLRRYQHWSQLNSQAIQDVVERVDRSYQAFFQRIREKRKGKKSPPKFRKHAKYASFTLKQTGYKFDPDSNVITIMGHPFRFHKSREVKGSIRTVTVKRSRLGEFYIFVVVRQEISAIQQRAGKAAGLDFGLKHFLILDDGRIIDSPQWFMTSLEELRAAHRSLSKCQKGSNNWKRAKKNLDRVYEKASNTRRDWFFKLAHQLTDEFAVICMEDLNLDGMKRLWGRKVSDLAFAEFVKILEYIAFRKGVKVVKISRWEPSSKACSVCGYINKELTLEDREWTCPCCGTFLDRDVNAAINIKRAGLKQLAAQ